MGGLATGPLEGCRVLVVDPGGELAPSLARASRATGADTVAAADADEAIGAILATRPDAVLATTAAREALAEALAPMAVAERPPLFAVSCAAEAAGAASAAAVMIPPVTPAAISAAVAPLAPPAERGDARLRALVRLSFVDAHAGDTLAELCAGLARAFAADDVLVWGGAGAGAWRASLRPAVSGAAALARAELAAAVAGTTLLLGPAAPGGHGALLAAPLTAGADEQVGAVCLVSDRPRLFGDDERRDLEAFAARLGRELSWVSAHRRLAEELERAREEARLDAHLGIANRAALERALTSEVASAARRGEPLSLALFDVDGMRRINDRHGHRAGDAVLGHIARTLAANIRSNDIIGRFGGDEIAVALIGADLGAARAVVEKLTAAVADSPHVVGGVAIAAEVHAGVTAVEADERSAEDALARAAAAAASDNGAQVRVAHRPATADTVSRPRVADIAPEDGIGAGTTLGGMYRILHELSRGAMGVVYRAEDMGLGRPVAIKVLRSDLASDRALVGRFREEAAMLASLHHTNLVQVYAFGSLGDEVYFVMELVEGQALGDVLHRLGHERARIGLAEVTQIVEEIADALEAMHAVGLIHRDVKPANILLDHINDRAVLVDVGVAKRAQDRGEAAGTPGYAAPESFTDVPEVAATDVYGLAATAYMMFTGTAPFGAGDVESIVQRQLSEVPPPPSDARPDLSTAVDDVILKALSGDPADRYQSAASFAVALAAALRRAPRGRDAPDAAEAPLRPAPRGPRRGAVPATLSLGSGGGATAAPPTRDGHVRGVYCRVAQKVLARLAGDAWLRQAADASEELAALLAPALPPLSWQPLDAFVQLLRRAAGGDLDGGELARAVGRSTMTASFHHLFGADPATLSPEAVVRAAQSFWSRYHSWSMIRVAESSGGPSGRATVHLAPDPSDPLLAEVVAGSLERVAELAGASGASCEHTAGRGAPVGTFTLTWRS